MPKQAAAPVHLRRLDVAETYCYTPAETPCYTPHGDDGRHRYTYLWDVFIRANWPCEECRLQWLVSALVGETSVHHAGTRRLTDD